MSGKACVKCQNMGWFEHGWGADPTDCKHPSCFEEKEEVDTFYGEKHIIQSRIQGCKELNSNLDCKYFKPFPENKSLLGKWYKNLRKNKKEKVNG